MRIVIDLQAAQGPSRHRGIGRYSLALTRGLIRNRGDHEIFVSVNGMVPHAIDEIRAALFGLIPNENIVIWDAPGPVAAANPQNDARRGAAELIRESALAALSPDYVLVSSLFEGFGEEIVTSVGHLSSTMPTAVILYDLIPLIHRGIYLPNSGIETWYENKIGHIRRADLLLAISESSRQEALTWLGADEGRTVNISTAADDHFTPGPVGPETRTHLADAYGLDRPFVMYTGGIDHRKNIEGLIRAYAGLPDDVRQAHRLAIVCAVQDADRQRLLKLAADEGLANGDVVLTGFISEEDLLACYRACKLFVFPSWHEGFGLPALEAMKCGRAVIVGNRSGLPEVVGLESAFFDPFDVASINAKMHEVLTNERLRAELERHGLKQALEFDWDKSARRAWAAMEADHARRVAAKNRPQAELPALVAGRRPRLAFVSPFAPEFSGISEYSAMLLPELARHYRIEIVTPTGQASDPAVVGNGPVRDATWFRQNAHMFDRVLYHFGNSQFHSHMFDLLHAIPGVVVLHDFFLSGVVSYREGSGEVPGEWTRSLAYSHGWPAVIRRYRARDHNDVLWEYPCNLPVLQDALGVIVHAEYSRQLARQWYGADAGRDWRMIPLLRTPMVADDRADPREDLGIPKDDFVVCSFGLLGPMKLNHRLLKAWTDSPMAQDPRCRLVFVGQNDTGGYGEEMERLIRSAPGAGRIEITGWIDQSVFAQWLAVADIGVQLRALSRGETSAAVLDCMGRGVATVVNAHGSMAELPQDAVCLLDDEFDDAALTAALTTLWQDRALRASLAAKGRAYIEEHHRPRHCADDYAHAIEEYYASAATGEHGLVRALSESGAALTDADWSGMTGAISRSLPIAPRPKRLLVDISVLAQVDARSGIQRVVRSILSRWLETPPDGRVVEPIYADPGNRCYRHARKFTCRFLNIPDDWCEDEPVEAGSGDNFVGLDYHPDIVPQQQSVLEEWRRRGVDVRFVVYDLLPVLLPDRFPGGTSEGHERWLETVSRFDGVVCISRAVADEFNDWLEERGPRQDRPFTIDWFHLGADTQGSVPTRGVPGDAEGVLALLRATPSFLAVGTMEPRKGHRQLLSAFNALWARDVRVNLVLVGKQGWMMEDFTAELRRHPGYGKRLFWLEAISDEYLDKVYEACSTLVIASEGEGFGLPVVEAARHGLSVLARDLPVFREVAGPDAAFFANTRDPEAIERAVTPLLQAGPAVGTTGSRWLTWEKSAEELADRLLAKQPPYRITGDGKSESSPEAVSTTHAPAK